MTNGEKFKTAKERAEAFDEFCGTYKENCCWRCPCYDVCGVGNRCAFAWLDLETPAEEPLPCPFCGCACKVNHGTRYGELYQVICLNEICGYDSRLSCSKEAAISAHNRVARAAKDKEANDD